MVLGKERSPGICPPPVPWLWVALTCGLIGKKGFARGSGPEVICLACEAGGTEGAQGLGLPQRRSEGVATAQVFLWWRQFCPDGPSRAGRGMSRHSRPGRAAVLQLCSVLPPGACPGRGPHGLPSPGSVPWRPSSASVMFTPKTGLPWAQLRSHHLEFKIAFSTVCWDS